MDLMRRLQQGVRGPGTPDPDGLRERLMREDPDFRHVRAVQHDAMNLISASYNVGQLWQRVADGRALRHEREFWQRQGEGP